MKHTEGTWKHDGEIIYTGNYTLNNGWVNHATIAKVEPHTNWEENAHLICAAPELLTACKEALGVLTEPGMMDVDEWKTWQKKAISLLTSAINDAEDRIERIGRGAGNQPAPF